MIIIIIMANCGIVDVVVACRQEILLKKSTNAKLFGQNELASRRHVHLCFFGSISQIFLRNIICSCNRTYY